MEFLKRHYEKIVLVVVLLGLGAAAVWIGGAISEAQRKLTPPVPAPGKTAPPAPIDVSADQAALAAIRKAPPVVLSGDHNLFNPVTWKRRGNGTLMKVLHTGPDALEVTSIIPLYTIVDYEKPSGNGPIYVMTYQTNCDLRHPNRKFTEYARVNEKMRSGLYLVTGEEGDPNAPTSLTLQIPQTGQTVAVAQGQPYKRVDGYLADMKYDPQSLTLLKKRVDDTIALDGEEYKIVEITNNAVRVESTRTKMTEIRWNP